MTCRCTPHPHNRCKTYQGSRRSSVFHLRTSVTREGLWKDFSEIQSRKEGGQDSMKNISKRLQTLVTSTLELSFFFRSRN